MRDLIAPQKDVNYFWAERSWINRQRARDAEQGLYPIILEERGSYLVTRTRRPYPSDVKVRTEVIEGVAVHWYRATPV